MHIDTMPLSRQHLSGQCVCESPGWCKRHGVRKGQAWFRLCQTDAKYRYAWDEGFGPGQVGNSRAEWLESARRRKEKQLVYLREMWHELHSYADEFSLFAGNVATWDAEEARIFYREWASRIPKFGCGCKNHFKSIVRQKQFRPDFSSPLAFYFWSIDVHNEVNRRLGKPQFSVLESMRATCRLGVISQENDNRGNIAASVNASPAHQNARASQGRLD